MAEKKQQAIRHAGLDPASRKLENYGFRLNGTPE
jgi:hypothetical protein